jgi:hypothetical protein
MSVCYGDKGGAEQQRAKVHCTRIAIVQVVAPDVRDRPKAAADERRLFGVQSDK